jgi:hypothetical protein
MLISTISRYPEFEKKVKMERSMEEGEKKKKKKKKMRRKNDDEMKTTPNELKKENGNKLINK